VNDQVLTVKKQTEQGIGKKQAEGIWTKKRRNGLMPHQTTESKRHRRMHGDILFGG